MRRNVVAILSSSAALMLVGCAYYPLGPVNGYSCDVERSDTRGALQLGLQLDTAGTPEGWSGIWTLRSGSMGLQSFLGQDGAVRFGDTARLNVVLFKARGAPVFNTGRVTVELRREGETQAILAFAAGSYNSDDGQSGMVLGKILQAAGGHPLEVVAKNGRGRIIGRGIFDPAAFDRAKTMIDEARNEVEAMRTDFRHRCTVMHGLAPGAPSPVIA